MAETRVKNVIRAGKWFRAGRKMNNRIIKRKDEQIKTLQNQLSKLNNFTPTPENVNALPENLRKYISDLSTICDPAGDVAALTLIKDQNEQLVAKIAETRAENERLAQCKDDLIHELIRLRVLKPEPIVNEKVGN